MSIYRASRGSPKALLDPPPGLPERPGAAPERPRASLCRLSSPGRFLEEPRALIYCTTHLKCEKWNTSGTSGTSSTSGTSGTSGMAPDRVSSAAVRTPPSTRAGGQDDGSYTNSLKLRFIPKPGSQAPLFPRSFISLSLSSPAYSSILSLPCIFWNN